MSDVVSASAVILLFALFCGLYAAIVAGIVYLPVRALMRRGVLVRQWAIILTILLPMLLPLSIMYGVLMPADGGCSAEQAELRGGACNDAMGAAIFGMWLIGSAVISVITAAIMGASMYARGVDTPLDRSMGGL